MKIRPLKFPTNKKATASTVAVTKNKQVMSTESTPGVKSDIATLTSEPRFSFEISRKLLEVMSLFQSGDETRMTLCNSLFEITRNGMRTELILVATDGKRLAVHTQEIATDNLLTSLPDSEKFGIDLVGVKKLPKVKGVKGACVTVTVFDRHAEVTCDKYKYRAKFLEGNYPTWRQVLPTTQAEPAKVFPFQWELFEDFGQAAKVFCKGGSCVELIPHVDEDHNVRLVEVRIPEYRSFYGVLMPVRNKEDGERDADQYDWIKQLAAGGEDRGTSK